MLTARQREVAALVARGMTDKQIARELGIHRRTVEWHISDGASRIPGEGRPRMKLAVFVLNLNDDRAA